jgi:hypothetical protein
MPLPVTPDPELRILKFKDETVNIGSEEAPNFLIAVFRTLTDDLLRKEEVDNGWRDLIMKQ